MTKITITITTTTTWTTTNNNSNNTKFNGKNEVITATTTIKSTINL